MTRDSMFDAKKTFLYPLEYAKDQNTVGSKEISGEWERGNFLVFPKSHLPHRTCKGGYMHPQLPLYEVTELTMKSLLITDFCYGVLVCCNIVSS